VVAAGIAIPRPWQSALAVLMPAVAGASMALLMPRGPVTSMDVVASLIICTVLGVLSGWLLGRWAVVIAPLLFAICFELGRLGVTAPSLEGIDLGSAFGIVLFVTTRGFHFVVALLPMALGAVIGSSARRRVMAGEAPLDAVPKTGVVALIVAIALAGVLIARPARTDPIPGEDGRPLPGSIAEVATVELGGHDQSIVIRGRDVTSPILLYLTGGPGNSDIGYTRTFLEELEDDLVLVAWDQRGAGKSYSALDPISTLTVDSAVSDVIDLSAYLIDRFGQERIFLLGNSWGSIIGVLAAVERPDLYHAYIGTGQMVSPSETDQILYAQMLQYAERIGDAELLSRMIEFGQPPYADIHAYMTVIEHYGNLEPYQETAEFAAGVPGIQGTGVSEYGFMDKLNVFRGLADMGGILYSRAQDIDLREDAPSLAVPVFFVQGANELTARSGLANEYAATVKAPSVTVEVFERSGHVPHFEEARRFHRFLVDVVVAGAGS
jgi:pimeloyl-ACP methyl ester carboxylesterase